MKTRILILIFSVVLCATSAIYAENSSQFYFKKWSMVKAFPQPQEPISVNAVESLKKQPESSYIIATYQPDKRLFSVEEIEKGKRKLRFEYFYADGMVDHIDLYLADGTKKPYFRRAINPQPSKGQAVVK